MAITIDWDEVFTFSRDHVVPVLKDNFFKKSPILVDLKGKADMFSGGPFIRQPLGFAPDGGGGQWWTGADEFDFRARNPVTAGNFFAKNFVLGVVILQDEEDAVNGPEEVMPLVANKTKIGLSSVDYVMGGQGGVYNDGSNVKAITGLQYALPDFTGGGAAPYNPGSFPSGKNYGGITTSSTVNTWWNSQGDATAYATGPAASYIQQANFAPWDRTLAAMRLAAGRTSNQIICNVGVWNEIKAMVWAKSTFFRPQMNDAMHQAGFDSFLYDNRITVVVDPFVPRDATTKIEHVYFVDTTSLHLWIHTSRNFEQEPFVPLIKQAARVSRIFFRGELAFDERRTSGVHSRVDTTLTSP